jgi:flagellar assembly protein FliH
MLREHENDVRPLQYPALSGTPAPVIELESPAKLADRVRDLESRLEERDRQCALQLESARHEALEQGKRQAGGEQAVWRQQCAGQLSTAIQEFRARKEEYLAQVEHEVVRLALAIAERILHREAQMDPMLLSSAVRVALGQLPESTVVRLRVPAEEREMWAEMVRLMPGLPIRPDVRADSGLQTCEAILEADSGTVDLGVHGQLEEIERGFFDLTPAHRNSNRNGADAIAGKLG